MSETKKRLFTYKNIETYLDALEKCFSGETITGKERELIREINLAVEYNPALEQELQNIYLSPVASTYSGMKLIFHEAEDKDREKDRDYPVINYTDLEWRSMRKAAASGGKLYNTIREKIETENREFSFDMPLDTRVTLHLEIKHTGTQWVVIPSASCPVAYKQDEEEKIQTKFMSLRLNVEELKDKGIFLEKGKIIIRKG